MTSEPINIDKDSDVTTAGITNSSFVTSGTDVNVYGNDTEKERGWSVVRSKKLARYIAKVGNVISTAYYVSRI